MVYAAAVFGERMTRTEGSASSPDLNPCYLFMGHMVTDDVYMNNPHSLREKRKCSVGNLCYSKLTSPRV